MSTTFMPNHRFSPGQVVFKKGDQPDGCYYICSGAVEVSIDGDVLATLEEGQVFGEMALVDKKPRSATVTAIDETWVYKVKTEHFEQKLAQLDPLMQGVIQLLVQIIRQHTGEREKAAPLT